MSSTRTRAKSASSPSRSSTPSKKRKSAVVREEPEEEQVEVEIEAVDIVSTPARILVPANLRRDLDAIEDEAEKCWNLCKMLTFSFGIWGLYTLIVFITGPQCTPLVDICSPGTDIYPVSERFIANFNIIGAPTVMLLGYIGQTIGMFTKIGGIPRNASAENNLFQTLQDEYISDHIHHKGMLPADYKYFGTQDHKTNLKLFLQNNGLFTSALQETRDSSDGQVYLDLKSYLDVGEEPKSWYTKIIGSMHNAEIPKVNARYDQDMNLVFMKLEGATLTNEDDIQRYSSCLVYCLVYYASAIHTMQHSWFHIYGDALTYATQGNSMMTAWGKPYSQSVDAKYQDTRLVLIGNGVFKIITGPKGFGGSPAVTPIISDMFRLWGTFKTADEFYYKYMLNNITPEVAARAGLLPQVKAQLPTINGFAAAIYAEFGHVNPAALAEADNRLATFLRDCGPRVSEVSDLKNFIHLAAISGILHGSTISYTRTIIIPEILYWRSPSKPTFDAGDGWLASVGMGTVVGIEDPWHVFSSSVNCYQDNDVLTPNMHTILAHYDAEALAIQRAYFAQIRERPDFSDFGWILTDNCPSGVDTKQQTLTGYV